MWILSSFDYKHKGEPDIPILGRYMTGPADRSSYRKSAVKRDVIEKISFKCQVLPALTARSSSTKAC